jgi:hypothetical protein
MRSDGIDPKLEHAVRRLACSTASELTVLFRRHVVQGHMELDRADVFEVVSDAWVAGGGREAAAEVAGAHKRAANQITDRPAKRCRALPRTFLSESQEFVACTPFPDANDSS